MRGRLGREASPRAVVAGVAVGIALLAGATWVLVISPRNVEARRLAAQIRSTEVDLKAALRSSRTAATKQAVNLTPVLRALPDAAGIPDVVLELSRIAAKAGVSLDTITPQPAVPLDGYYAVPITVVVSGKFFAVSEFLRGLRTQVTISGERARATGRLYDVDGIQIAQAVPAPLVTATLAVRTFAYPSGAAALPSGSPSVTPAALGSATTPGGTG